ncbi:Uncharacterised protein [Neisseria meningitidis]|nr:Uncharacterised protein [Neisseria meningitidis]CWN07440.1 Uncharacterised protein [Neisseria meningitidis]CWN22798.1 Uncharacterised protein [Neisseria meningitidis]CWN31910.1 Uncharacterised protein [Neisseria meningitidis]CWN54599.1 Uncharacterised protein [Neisseria meningitidis]
MGDDADRQFGFVQFVFTVIALAYLDADKAAAFLDIQLVLVDAFFCQQLQLFTRNQGNFTCRGIEAGGISFDVAACLKRYAVGGQLDGGWHNQVVAGAGKLGFSDDFAAFTFGF